MSPWFAMVLAPTLQPWAVIGAGAATVMEAKLSSWESYLTLALFCVLASASYLAIETYAVIRPDQSQAFLARFRTWLETHTDQLLCVGAKALDSQRYLPQATPGPAAKGAPATASTGAGSAA